MNMEQWRAVRSFVVFALCSSAALSITSCRLMQRGSPSWLELNGEPTGTDCAVSARFVTAEDDVPGFFKKLMPDGGIVPVRVVIRNNGARALLIHSANGMKTGSGFDGLKLAAGGTTYLPVHPKEVVARLLGATKAGRYRRHGAFGFIAGTFVPPLAVYYIYNEVDIGRYYRPLFTKSFYPSREDGMFDPVRIEPAQERGGYLYFAIPKGTRPDSCELVVSAGAPVETRDSLRGSDFRFSRDELPLTEAKRDSSGQLKVVPGSCEAPYGFLFALAGDERAGAQGLYFARVRELNPQSDSLWTFVTLVSSKSASIADASCIGSLAACAVNFKSKSKVYLMQCAEAPDIFEERHFSRGIRRVFLHTGGAFVVTDDGACHSYNGASHTWTRATKLGTDVDEAGLYRGMLFAFLKRKEICVFGTTGAAPLTTIERHPLGQRALSALGLLDEEIALLNRGSAVQGDAISLFGIETRGEAFGCALPGKVNIASSEGSSLIAQLEQGTVVRIGRGPLGALDIVEAGYLPFKVRALKAAPHGFIAVGETGALAIGSVDSWSPGSRGAIEVTVKVR